MVSVPTRILVVAATERELASGAWRTLCCGVGPVEAAAATAQAIATARPDAVLHVGVAGARRARGFEPASLVIGTEARYGDLPTNPPLPPKWAAAVVHASPVLLVAAQGALPMAVSIPIGTSARVGGTADCDVEAMEGFGVLRAAQLAGVPAVEVRAIANDIEEDDRTRWHLHAAFDAITAVTPTLVQHLISALAAAAPREPLDSGQ